MTQPYLIRVLSKYNVSEGTVLGTLPYYMGMIDPVVMIALRCHDSKLNANSVQEITVDVENRDSSNGEDWLLHVQSARMEEEQNVVLTSRNGKLICVAKKRIKAKTELLIWYGDELLNVLGANDPTVFTRASNNEDEYKCKYCDEKFKFCNAHTAHVLFKCPRRHLAVLQDIPKFQMKSLDAKKEPRSNGESMVKQVSSQSVKEMRCDKRTPSIVVAQKRRGEECNENHEIKLMRESSANEQSNKQTSINVENINRSSERNNDRTFSAFRRVDNASKRSKENDLILTDLHTSSTSKSKMKKEDPVQIKKPSPVSPHSKPPFQGTFGLASPLNLAPMDAMPKIGSSKSPDMTSSLSFMDHSKLIMPNFLPEPSTGLHRGITGYTPASTLVGPSPMMSIPPQINSMLPATMATVSFSNENWCAKCNASFRMTSDLVYHMRTHHKREFDGNRKKRDDKLKCQICNETFRERHHLTRHMTSHM